MALPTLREVWRLALPGGTRLAVGKENLDRQVVWARRMGTRPPLLGALEAGELALLSLAKAQRVDERLSLTQIVAALAELQAVGAGVVAPVSQEAVAAAEERDIPLFALPPNCDLREVERAVIRLIVEREAQLDRRGRQIYRQLAQLSLAQEGLGAIVEALRDLTGKGVLFQDATGRVVEQAWPADEGLSEPLRQRVEADQGLLTWLSGQALDDRAPPTTERPMSGTSLTRCVAGVVVQGQLGGYLSIVGPGEELDDLDRLAVERGALVCAVELAKQRAVALAEDRLRGEFLEALLAAPLPDRAWLEQHAAEIGYRLDGLQTALVFRLEGQPGQHAGAQEWLARSIRFVIRKAHLETIVGSHEGEVRVLCRGGGGSDRALVQVARRICRQAEGAHCRVMAGIGRSLPGIEGARRSYRQAREALEMAHRLPTLGPVVSFTDLGLLRLFCQLRGSSELASFCQEQLGALLAYDEEHGTELVPTLRAFFAACGNISRTAERMHLHRNSLIYRLRRIAEVAGVNLDDAEDRFNLQLALKLMPLLDSPALSPRSS